MHIPFSGSFAQRRYSLAIELHVGDDERRASEVQPLTSGHPASAGALVSAACLRLREGLPVRGQGLSHPPHLLCRAQNMVLGAFSPFPHASGPSQAAADTGDGVSGQQVWVSTLTTRSKSWSLRGPGRLDWFLHGVNLVVWACIPQLRCSLAQGEVGRLMSRVQTTLSRSLWQRMEGRGFEPCGQASGTCNSVELFPPLGRKGQRRTLSLEPSQPAVEASSCSSGSTPSPGTSICCRCGPKEKKKREKKKEEKR